MYKDRTFKIFNTKYKIKFVNKVREFTEDGPFTFGECDSSRFIIKIATKDRDGKPLSDDVIKTTTLHEIIHAIFTEGQYQHSSNDEPLVEWTAKCIKSLQDQKII